MPVGTALLSYDFRAPDVRLLANESNNICADSRQNLGKLSLRKGKLSIYFAQIIISFARNTIVSMPRQNLDLQNMTVLKDIK